MGTPDPSLIAFIHHALRSESIVHSGIGIFGFIDSNEMQVSLNIRAPACRGAVYLYNREDGPVAPDTLGEFFVVGNGR